MKWRLHLAIYTYLALSLQARAGWHTNEPFVAWPASNHLRWVTNVGTYTNAPEWTNAAYGQWTNNYLVTNLWVGTGDYGPYAFPYPIDGGTVTQMHFNAKDTRMLDLIDQTARRFIAGSPLYTESNIWFYLLYDVYGDSKHDPLSATFENFYRNERMTVQILKAEIKNELLPIGWYYWKPSITDYVEFTVATLCSNAAVPPNFFDYTPARGADMTTTPYGRILTNYWTVHTTNTAPVTNIYLDSFGVEHELAGTNNQVLRLVVTNSDVQVGWSFLDYSVDGLRRVLTNLYITVVENNWGVGYGTNSIDTGTNRTDFSCTGTLNPYIAQTDGVHEWDFVGIGLTEVQSFGAFGVDWHWTNGTDTPLCFTGQPPSVVWGAEYSIAHLWRIAYSGERAPSINYVSMDISARTTNQSVFAWYGTRKVYNAPLLTTIRLSVPVVVESYATSNGAAFLVDSISIASAGVITSAFTQATAPAIDSGFGITSNAVVGYADYYTPTTDPVEYYFAAYSILPFPSGSGGESISTNLPTYAKYRSVIKWDF